MQYVVSTWELVALVVLPFLFGMLFGMHVYEKKIIIRLIKKTKDEDLTELIEDEN